jgi:hypothetical protein
MGVRQDIASAASSLTGVSVEPYVRRTLTPGDGYVQFLGMEIDDTGLGFMERWVVIITISQDDLAAQMWIEENSDALIDALSPHLIVTSVVPWDVSGINAVHIAGSRGH